MIRIFETGMKVNFVDDNNVVLGYDLSQSCCETADWFIAKTVQSAAPLNEPVDHPKELDGWQFDPTYFQEVQASNLDCGGMVVFKLVKGRACKYLHLFNCHNGYYGHGFEFKIGEELKQSGTL